MNYGYYNSNFLSKIQKNNTPKQISTIDNIEKDINNYNSNRSQISSPYFNCFNNYISYNNNNVKNISIQNNNYYYKKIKSPIIKRNIIKEEIKNFDYSEDYYKNYNFTPKNFNYDSTKVSKNKKIDYNIDSIQNSLCDYFLSNQKDKKKIKLVNQNQYSSVNISPQKILNNNNYFINNSQENISFRLNQNISPIKNNLFYNIKRNDYDQNQNKEQFKKIKKQIIYVKKDNSNRNQNNNKIKINLTEPFNSIPNIPKNDVSEQNLISSDFKNKKTLNIIPIPRNIRIFNDFENRKNLFPTNDNIKKTNRNKSISVKKNLINIDINIDYDKNNQEKYFHKKNKSSILKNDSFSNKNDNTNVNTIVNNIQLNKNTPNLINGFYKNNSAKILNKKIINNTLIEKDNFNNDPILKISKKSNIKKLFPRPKKIIKIKGISHSNNDSNINFLPENFHIFWGGKSQAGKDSKGNIKTNQDAFKVYENINHIKNFNIFILCDGHGKDGHHVSQFVTEYITNKISIHPLISSIKELDKIYQVLIDFNYKIIKEIFSETDIYLSNQKDFDTYVSGTTCVLVLQIGNKLICANSGDSRAILIYSTDNYNKGQLINTKIFPLSQDAKPDLPSEINRIINCGGEVHRGKNRHGKYVGPMRVFAKGKDYPGLAMSRSLGDFQVKNMELSMNLLLKNIIWMNILSILYYVLMVFGILWIMKML